MADATGRLRRLLEDDLGYCQDSDVEERLGELRSLTEQAFQNDEIRRVFAVLGDDTRYRLARVLAASGEELCVCELEPVVDVSDSAVSHALSDLVDAGLVDRRKAGNWRYYQTTRLTESLFDTADQHAATHE